MELNKDLSSLNTFGIKVYASRFTEVKSNGDVLELLADDSFDIKKSLVLGGGSNVLFTTDYSGLIIKNQIRGFTLSETDESNVWVTIGAGENWHETVLKCIDNGWAGIENLSLIPGNAGAAPIQNIGAYGVELKDVFYSLEWINFETRKTLVFTKDECEFGYRNSIFKNKLKGKGIVTNITLKLSQEAHINTSYGAIQKVLEKKGVKTPNLKQVSDAIIDIRQSKLPDPGILGNGGSFFKNPVIARSRYEDLQLEFKGIPGYTTGNSTKVPAGWLIEQAGWKGFRTNNIGVHKDQALVLVNYGGAKGSQIKDLAMDIQKSVLDKFEVLLEPEVNII